MKYRNTRAPFHRADGTIVERDQVIEPTEQELRLWGYKLRPVGGTVPETGTDVPTPRMGATLQPRAHVSPRTPASPGATATAASVKPAVTDPRWPLSMHPELYLKLHPKGLHATTARQVLGLPEEQYDAN